MSDAAVGESLVEWLRKLGGTGDLSVVAAFFADVPEAYSGISVAVEHILRLPPRTTEEALESLTEILSQLDHIRSHAECAHASLSGLSNSVFRSMGEA